MKKIPGIMIAAPKSGSGKTVVTCALLKAFQNRGMCPRAFKCGPDYIDPMFHRRVLDVPSCNLDSYFLEEEQIAELYAAHAGKGGISVIEGAMGLFDGIGGIKENGSAYHIASILDLPVVLVVDAHGMGRSLLSLLAGFLQYDREKRIAGILLNRVSKNFYERIAPVIETELSVRVFGFLPIREEFVVESRHLGLKLPGEMPALKKQIACMAGLLEETVSVEAILQAVSAAGASELPGEKRGAVRGERKAVLTKRPLAGDPVRIGVARDEAFCFYYEENLSVMEKAGAELVFFSPLHDQDLPKDLDGLLLGGGYPELYAKELEENTSMRKAVKQAIHMGMPSLAECGGFMYLHERVEDEKGKSFEMCGSVPGKCFCTGRSVRFGYLELTEKKQNFLKQGTCIRGHEFHYYDSEDNGRDCIAKKPMAGRQWDCVHGGGNAFWGFPHLYYLSNPGFVWYFIEKAKKFRKGKKK